MPLQQVIQQDLSRGTNVVSNPWDLGGQQSVFLGNCMLDEHGSIRTRQGTSIVTTSPDRREDSILTFGIANGGAGYAVGDTGTIDGGVATYLVGVVDGGGAVTSLTLPFTGAGYAVGAGVATTPGPPQPGGGAGLTIDINSVGVSPGPYRSIIKLYDFILSDGTLYPLAILKGVSQQNQVYNRGTTPWTLIGDMTTKFPIPDILTFTNLAIIADGYETPWSYDGTTFVQLVDNGGGGGVPRGAQHHALHQGFYWVWNTAPGSGVQPPVAATLTTNLPTPDSNITYTAVTPGVGGNGITIGYTNGLPTPDQLLAVIVVGQQITVFLATDFAGTPTSTALDVIAAVNGEPAAAALVTAALAPGNLGTGIVGTMVYTALTGGGSPAVTDLDGPSSLRSSDLNNPNSWPAANQIWVDKDDGDQGMGMGQFTIAESGISPTTSQILFKTFTGYQMTGVFGSTNPAFTIQRIKSDMGCVAPRTIQFAPGFGLIRLTHRGFALFDGVDDRLISEEVRPLIFGSAVYTSLNWALVNTSYATVVANPPMYVAYCPTGDNGLDRVFMYDLVRKAWAIFSFANQISTVQSIRDPGQLPFVLTGDFNEGRVREVFGASITDSGTPITVQWLPKPVSAGSPQQNGYYRRLVLKVTDADPARPISITTLFGPVTSNPPRQITKVLLVPVAVGLGLGYGLLPYGTSPYGGVPANAEVDLTCDLGLIATNARAIISWQGPLRVRGIEWHVKAKPLRRVSLYTRELPQ